MLAFMTNEVPFFSYLSNILLFLPQIRNKYATSVVATKIELFLTLIWILADEACRFTNFSNVLSHDDIITILY